MARYTEQPGDIQRLALTLLVGTLAGALFGAGSAIEYADNIQLEPPFNNYVAQGAGAVIGGILGFLTTVAAGNVLLHVIPAMGKR